MRNRLIPKRGAIGFTREALSTNVETGVGLKVVYFSCLSSGYSP